MNASLTENKSKYLKHRIVQCNEFLAFFASTRKCIVFQLIFAEQRKIIKLKKVIFDGMDFDITVTRTMNE